MLREQGLAARTIANRVARISCFLRHHKITGLLEAHEKPRYVEREPKAFNEVDLRALFSVSDDEEELLFRFFLYSGCREQEVAHLTYRDLDFVNKTITVSEKATTDFRPKDRQERTVPLPDALMRSLAERRNERKGAILVFPNKLGTVEGLPETLYRERSASRRAYVSSPFPRFTSAELNRKYNLDLI
jgi:integrase/recombinase XerD